MQGRTCCSGTGSSCPQSHCCRHSFAHWEPHVHAEGAVGLLNRNSLANGSVQYLIYQILIPGSKMISTWKGPLGLNSGSEHAILSYYMPF